MKSQRRRSEGHCDLSLPSDAEEAVEKVYFDLASNGTWMQESGRRAAVQRAFKLVTDDEPPAWAAGVPGGT